MRPAAHHPDAGEVVRCDGAELAALMEKFSPGARVTGHAPA
ncbi:hypothetical protein [Streptomyces mirabilis]